jgi:brefeldin A-resistance guanine nucleotide exchange factor 1
VRHLAFTSLQRALLSPELTSSDHNEWTAIFGEVLFPLILRLLKPEVFSTDRDGMSETRVQAASLLCKVFLQYLVLLSTWDGMLDLWLKIIEIMDRLINSGQGDSLVSPSRYRSVAPANSSLLQEEAVPENLKNVLLFMSSSGCLVPPSQNPEREQLWTETWKRIDRFLPDLKNELLMDDPKVQEPPPNTAAPQEGPKVEEKAA